MSDGSLLEEFSIEASELLEDAEESLLSIEGGTDIEGNFNKVFRSFHSLKGSAGMMGFEEIQKHMHLSEDRFESFKENKEELPHHIEYFLGCVDHCRRLLAGEVAEFSHDSFSNNESEKKVEATGDAQTRDSTETVYFVDVIGADVSQTDLFKKNGHAMVSNVITDLNTYIKNKGYTGKDAVIVDNSVINEFNNSVRDQIPVLVMGEVHPEEQTQNILTTKTETLSSEEFLFALKTSRMLNRSINTIEKSIRLLFYQFSDLDKYLAESGKEQVRATLREEINSILMERNEVFK